MVLSAQGSQDPDGDELTYHWFHYGEAERDLPNVRDIWKIPLTGSDSDTVEFTVTLRIEKHFHTLAFYAHNLVSNRADLTARVHKLQRLCV